MCSTLRCPARSLGKGHSVCTRSDPTRAAARCMLSIDALAADSPDDSILSRSRREAPRWWTNRARSRGPRPFRFTVSRPIVASGLSTGTHQWNLASLGWSGAAVSGSAGSSPHGGACRHDAGPRGPCAVQPPFKPTTKAGSAVIGANAMMNGMLNSWSSQTHLPSGVPECPQQCSTWYLRNKRPSQTSSCVPDRAWGPLYTARARRAQTHASQWECVAPITLQSLWPLQAVLLRLWDPAHEGIISQYRLILPFWAEHVHVCEISFYISHKSTCLERRIPCGFPPSAPREW